MSFGQTNKTEFELSHHHAQLRLENLDTAYELSGTVVEGW